MRLAALSFAVMLVLAACGQASRDDIAPSTDNATQSSEAQSTTTVTAGVSDSTTIPTTADVNPPTTTADQTTPPTEGDEMTGSVPEDLLANILADAAQRIGVAQSDIEVIRARPATWNDGSLGCPEPGMSYTQALVDGYWVVLEHGGIEYDYRASAHGYFRLCVGGGSPPSDLNI